MPSLVAQAINRISKTAVHSGRPKTRNNRTNIVMTIPAPKTNASLRKFEIPLDVIQAAARLKAFFRYRGVDEWILDGICSQSFAKRAFDAEAEVSVMQPEIRSAWMLLEESSSDEAAEWQDRNAGIAFDRKDL